MVTLTRYEHAADINHSFKREMSWVSKIVLMRMTKNDKFYSAITFKLLYSTHRWGLNRNYLLCMTLTWFTMRLHCWSLGVFRITLHYQALCDTWLTRHSYRVGYCRLIVWSQRDFSLELTLLLGAGSVPKEKYGARGVIVIAVGNEHGDTSSNPGRDWLHFT